MEEGEGQQSSGATSTRPSSSTGTSLLSGSAAFDRTHVAREVCRDLVLSGVGRDAAEPARCLGDLCEVILVVDISDHDVEWGVGVEG